MISAFSEYRMPEDIRGTILEKIVRSKLAEIDGARRALPAICIRQTLERAPAVRSFRRAILRHTPAIVAEIKRASPSAGILRTDFRPRSIAEEYQRAGAAAISVLTEVKHFGGGLEILADVRWHARLPLLRKDFIVDAYQVLEARRAGADAVLLIAALLDDGTLRGLIAETESLGMDALVEVHTMIELERVLGVGASVIGVNNRDLRTFEVSLETSLRLAERIPSQTVSISESGIRTPEDIQRLTAAGYRGVLVGEHLLRAEAPGAALSELLGRHERRRAS
jgi:indole-3-glycerol phosphate synthase